MVQIDVELLELETSMSRGRFDDEILYGPELGTHSVAPVVANSGEASRNRSLQVEECLSERIMEDTLIDVKWLDLDTETRRIVLYDIHNYIDPPWTHLVTPGNNNLVHIVANTREVSRFQSLLENRSDVWSALLRQNTRGETPLHCAARRGNISFVNLLISNMSNVREEMTRLLTMKNKQGDTVLHLATRNNHFEVVDSLMNENDYLGSLANNSGECPLYIAAFKGFHKITKRLVKTTATGPGRMNALHAASSQGHLDVVELLLDKRPELCRERDEKGGTPLFCMASISDKGAQKRINKIVQVLVDKDISCVLLTDYNSVSVLHVAAGVGYIDVLQEILGRRRDFWELVDNTGKTFLHVAIEFKREEIVRYVLKDLVGVEELLNQPDDEGNTSLHLAVHGSELGIVRMLLEDKRVVLDSVNQNGQTPFDLAISVFWENPQRQLRTGLIHNDLKYFGMRYSPGKCDLVEFKSYMDRSVEEFEPFHRSVSYTMAVVAVFIATVTFAAGFTLPGGYKNDAGPEQGTAALTKSTAFKVFLISDTLAMITSILIIWFLFRMDSIYHDVRKGAFLTSSILLFFAFLEMIVAFVAGVYAVISDECLWLSILICSITCILPLAWFTRFKWAYGINPSRVLVFSRTSVERK